MAKKATEKEHAYLVRIPDPLWKDVRLRAIRDELSIRDIVLKLLGRYVKKGLD